MRSYLSKDAFFVKMKKKPQQQEVYDNIDNYTAEQLEALPSNYFPRWMKDALIRLKENDRAAVTAVDIAEQMNKYHQERVKNDLEL